MAVLFGTRVALVLASGFFWRPFKGLQVQQLPNGMVLRAEGRLRLRANSLTTGLLANGAEAMRELPGSYTCCICLEDHGMMPQWPAKFSRARSETCGHRFHEACAKEWIATVEALGRTPACPVCGEAPQPDVFLDRDFVWSVSSSGKNQFLQAPKCSNR